jgi:hypothetical protein
MRDDIAAYEKVKKTLSLPYHFEMKTHARTKPGDDGQTRTKPGDAGQTVQ